MSEGRIVLGYHGCDVTVRDRLVKGSLSHLTPSANKYDWLGGGVYFFEGDAERALDFAQASCDHPKKHFTAKPIVKPSVVGAVLCVSRCWDMTTLKGRRMYAVALAELRAAQAALDRPMPVNESTGADDHDTLLRRLDCAVFNIGHQMWEQQHQAAIQLMRAAFYQGKRVTDTSEFRTGTHIQLALRDPTCVLGWFLPPRIGPALLSDDELADADSIMAAADLRKTASKPRVRASP